MSTYFASAETAQRDWFVIDASGQTLGRLASEIARRLRGKHKPEFTPHADAGDYIIVINAEKVAVTGNKMRDKIYYKHTGYIGTLKETSLEKMLERNPTMVLEKAIKGMLPKGPLGYAQFRKLKVYVGPEHPHAAQQPQTFELKK